MLLRYGANTIEDQAQSPILKFLSYFNNPLAYAMEVAAIVSFELMFMVHNPEFTLTGEISLFTFDWLDFGLILALLFVNATIGFWEEARAGSAVSFFSLAFYCLHCLLVSLCSRCIYW
jgi:H+-transporting ATPase